MVNLATHTSLAGGWFLCAVCAAGVTLGAAPAHAQSGAAQSRAVVQPLPPAGVSDLNSALRRLASNTRDLSALIDAGNASLELNDVDAAIGFFGRADELSPGNAQVKLGLAGAFVRSERPLEALRLFDEAERAGASSVMLAADRGLAFDLVGDPQSAQVQYARALALRPTDEIVRRMAISQAIAGDRAGFEKTLYPLLEKRDLSGYRTRAFGLAILGEEAEAVSIAEAVMPAQLSAKITPYLRYMKRLTTAQQAAAANLGAFPRAAQIGRDDPRIAQYTPPARSARRSDTQLTPQGEPLGPRTQPNARSQSNTRSQPKKSEQADTRSQRRRLERAASSVAKTTRTPRAARYEDPGPAVSSSRARTMRVARADNSATRPQQSAPIATVTQPVPVPQPQPVPAGSNPAPLPPAGSTLAAVVARQSQPAAPQRIELPPSTAVASTESPAPGFDLAEVGPSPVSTQSAVVTATPLPAEKPAESMATASVADAFAELAMVRTAPDISGAVDIRSIKPPREKAAEAESKPEAKAAAKPAAKPAPKPAPIRHPSRFWVQVATGKDPKALAFDWRKMGRKMPEILGKQEAYVADWGQTRRLLTGPYDSLKAAQAAVAALKKAGTDSFTFTSVEGEEVQKLK
ncbi:hypothetical protein GRI44_01805 [Altererythrobacter confluentis]|uniref:SPOR domain-containing protein n=1 Tax=Allopontixanthobacter confluentis TaxID=1849021 RepID=A0A6L7GD04_9SPHN|nr:tetratricopeptide repeat protein [Allopontixanthobacter confluentis]MXP13490.1 hypothetical protein [Allopontixanthobacter confluentis]